MAYFPAGGQTYSLQSSISSTQTTITLSSFLVPVSGDPFTMALMNTSIAYGTIAPRTSQSEFISFTGITNNGDGTYTLTGVTRGLNKTYPFTEDTDFKLPHPGGSQFILSDAPQVFNQYSVIQNDETITGRKQFPTAGTASAAVVGASYVAPVQDNEIATKKYVDDTAAFGAPLATQTTAGIVILPRATQLEAGTLYSDATTANVGLVVMNSQYGARKILGYNVTAGSANAYTLDVGSSAPTTYATGAIIGFQASFTNTGNATVNVSGLGAKNLFLGSTGLFSGVITTGAYVGAVYDGTQFEITEGSELIGTTGANKIVLTKSDGKIDKTNLDGLDIQTYTTAGSGTWTKPTGAKWVEVTVIGGGGGGATASSGNKTGGGGGGAYGFKRFNASALGTTESYTVGAGGAGGTQAGTNDGTSGGASTFGTTTLLRAPGGSGGTATAGAGGVIGNGDIVYAGGAGNVNGAAGVSTDNVPSPRGGGGGGFNGGSPPTATAGGNGGGFTTNYVRAGGSGGAAGVNNGTSATAAVVGLLFGGVGGGGGGYNGTGTNTGGNGGNGGTPGGGGGGANGTGTTAGNGADGAVIVVTYF